MSPPWMPLYIADYLADTGHLTTEEHGAYLLLTMHYWRTGGLPQGASDLATVCRLSPKRWSQIGPKIARLFKDGWKHKRIDSELTKAEEKHRKRAAAGKRGGSAKAGAKQTPSNATANGCQSQPDKGSEATASGGEPPLETPRERLWRVGRPALLALNLPEKQLGPMIGRWLNDCGDDHDRVLGAIARARDACPTGPIGWITAHLKSEKSNAKAGQSVSSAAAELVAWTEERERERSARDVLAIGGGVLDGSPDEELHRRAAG